jgi:hypothetical protein
VRMDKQVTIKTAVRLTKKSDSTVRRWLRDLPGHDVSKYVRRDNGRVLIDRAFLIQSFDLDQVPTVSVDGFDPPGRPGVNVDAIIEHQARQIDTLLDQVANKDNELKNAWSMVLQLQNELKRLQAPTADGGRSDALQTWLLIALFAGALAVMVYLVATT